MSQAADVTILNPSSKSQYSYTSPDVGLEIEATSAVVHVVPSITSTVPVKSAFTCILAVFTFPVCTWVVVAVVM